MDLERSGDFLHASLDVATHVFVHSTPKFKTTTVRVMTSSPLDERASWRALVPAVLRRGTRALPSKAELARALESLYGASLGYDVVKMGEHQAVIWSLDIVNERFVRNRNGLCSAGLDLLRDVLLDPVLESGAFRKDYVEQERVNLVRFIEGLINDKVSYAAARMLQEMYRGEPYALYEWGTVESLAHVEPEELYASYRTWLATLPVDMYVVGELEPEAIVAELAGLLAAGRQAAPAAAGRTSPTPTSAVRSCVEEQVVSQSKLVIGCRVDMTAVDDDMFVALGLMNVLLGGGMHSRLFKQVREKESLAYYATSGLDRLKGCLVISCGISAENFEKARDISLRQLEIIAAGDFGDDELEMSRQTVLNRLRGIPDHPAALIDFLASYRAAGRHPTIAEIIERVTTVSRGELASAAQRVKPDTIYLMKGTASAS
ncbi:MAG: insulinase family protein [Planctomycetota bacterium]